MIRLALFLALLIPLTVSAHEVRPALLTISEVAHNQFLVRWKVPAMGDRRIAIDPIFATPCETIGDEVDGFAQGASLRSWTIQCPEGLADTDIAFTNLPSTMVDVLVQISFLDGRYYTGLVRPSAPTFHVPTRDSQASVFTSYLVLGIQHILFGWDHLLFVLGLTLLVPDTRRLIWAITGFTLAHSITLALAMLDIIQVPGPPVEAAIALSILFLAIETIRHQRTGVETLAIRAPWLISTAIGLIHGLGFAGALSQYGLPPYAKFNALLAFNLGVETGQLAFIATLILLTAATKKRIPKALPPLQLAATYLIGVSGSFWLIQRITGFFT